MNNKHVYYQLIRCFFISFLFFTFLLNNITRADEPQEDQPKGSSIPPVLLLLLGEESPKISVNRPGNGSIITTRTPSITIVYTAGSFDVNPSTLVVKMNGNDITSLFVVSEKQATATITEQLGPGINTLSATIKDKKGNKSSATSRFTVDIFEVSISATPNGGSTPLEVSFQPEITGWTPPYSYQWDIDGDGSIDDTRESFAYIFGTSGTYQVSLQIEDSRGQTETANTTINVLTSPTIIASAEPVSGLAPLAVSFSATVNEADGSITLYEWDFNGDGTYDYSSATTATTSYTYNSSGAYTPALRVTDSTGATATDSLDITIGTPPLASAEATPNSGTAPLSVDFSGSATDGDGSIVLYEWDFDGDGAYDHSSSTNGNTSHVYSSSGVYNATLRATDNDGLSATSSIIISVAGPPTSLPGAFPTSGEAPLTVTFFSDGQDLDGSPEYYDWDFDGDGTRDIRLIASMNTTYTFEQAGTYNAELTVIDNEGLSTAATIQIIVTESTGNHEAPTVNAKATPSNGATPLEVLLAATASDANGDIAQYEWDFENDGTYDFTELVTTAITLGEILDLGSYASPHLADIDNDGDLDLLVGASSGYIHFLQNNANNDQPNWENIGTITDYQENTIDLGSYSTPTLVDIDNDGDLDILSGERYGRIYLYRNDGSQTSPIWTPVDYLTDSSDTVLDVGNNSYPALIDVDNDGDLDLFVGESGGTIHFFQNDGTPNSAVWNATGAIVDSELSQIDVGYNSSPFFIDTDNDGDFDILSGASDGRILRIENTGSKNNPIWTVSSYLLNEQGTEFDIGSNSTPVFYTPDSQTNLVMIIGESGGRLPIYDNENAADLTFKLRQLYLGYVGVNSYGAATLADIDNDLDQDLFIGDNDGTIYFYRNIGSQTSPAWAGEGVLRDETGAIIDIGSRAKLAIADIDGDSDLDLYSGEYYGQVYYYRNDGNPISSGFVNMGAVSTVDNTEIDVGSHSSPAFADIDDDGDYDLLIGESGGRIYLYQNTNNSISPSWEAIDYLQDSSATIIDVGSYSTPHFIDSDIDGDLDLFIGNNYGTVSQYENTGTPTTPIWNANGTLLDSSSTQIDVGSYCAISLADLDADGDLDYFISNSGGLVYQYENIGNVLHSYTSIRNYTATLRVTDSDGNETTESVLIEVKGAGTPSALANATPQTGNAPLEVSFSGQGYDPNGNIVLYEWDFDGDGTFDFSSPTSGNTSHTYQTSGTFNATLKVTDNQGNSSTEEIPITSNFVISTTRSEIFNPVNGETAQISFTITGEALVTNQVIDINGNVIKTLADNEYRTTGTYIDTWDGTGTNNSIVKDGVYYFYIECVQDGNTTVYDLRESATFEEITPNRSWPSTFSPYEDDVVEVTYSIDSPSLVSLYFWKRDTEREESSIAPVRTLFIREPRQAGSYADVWDGVDDNGIIVGSWDGGYPITLWVYTLPENAIIVTGNTPAISNIDAEPNYFTPAYNPYAQNADTYTSVSFELSKSSTVTSSIRNGNGVIIKTITKANLPAGNNTILWDGTDYNGNLVQSGSYSISLSAVDANGNQSTLRYAAVYVHY